MKTQDVIDPDYKQLPVKVISLETRLQMMSNPVYYPIFMSLRDGYKTVKEIEADYAMFVEKEARKKGLRSKKDVEKFVKSNTRSDKSLYRYIQHMIDAEFVVTVGKRVAIDKPMTEKLFARTAKFFFVDTFDDKMLCTESNCIESMIQLLELIYDVPKPKNADFNEFVDSIKESTKQTTSLLFGEKAEEFVQIVEKLSLDEITAVLQMVSMIDLVFKSKNYSKLTKSLGMEN